MELSVYCIINEESRVLYEVCSSLDVALKHCEADCYRLTGIKVCISKRFVWSE